jgi:hypothetical protein
MTVPLAFRTVKRTVPNPMAPKVWMPASVQTTPACAGSIRPRAVALNVIVRLAGPFEDYDRPSGSTESAPPPGPATTPPASSSG